MRFSNKNFFEKVKITKIDITYLDLPSLVKYENSTPYRWVRYVTVCPPKSNHRVALGKNVKNKVKIEIKKILALQSFVREKCQVRFFHWGVWRQASKSSRGHKMVF